MAKLLVKKSAEMSLKLLEKTRENAEIIPVLETWISFFQTLPRLSGLDLGCLYLQAEFFLLNFFYKVITWKRRYQLKKLLFDYLKICSSRKACLQSKLNLKSRLHCIDIIAYHCTQTLIYFLSNHHLGFLIISFNMKFKFKIFILTTHLHGPALNIKRYLKPLFWSGSKPVQGDGEGWANHDRDL